MFGDPREELLKFITRELYKVVNADVTRYKRLRTVGVMMMMVMTMITMLRMLVLKRQKDQGLLASSIKRTMNRSWI